MRLAALVPRALIGIAITFGAPPAFAGYLEERMADAVARMISPQLRGAAPEDFLARARASALSKFKRYDRDGNGFSQHDLDFVHRSTLAKRRGKAVGDWLAPDLNWDGRVTEEELRAFFQQKARRPLQSRAGIFDPSEEQVEATLELLVSRGAAPDLDGDGVRTMDEMRRAAFAKHPRGSGKRRLFAEIRFGQAFDADADGTTTRAEFERAMDVGIAIIDADGNGRLSEVEVRDVHARAQRQRTWEQLRERAPELRREMRDDMAGCAFPTSAEDARFVYVTVGEGTAMPTVTLGGDGVVTTLVRVSVDPGPAPIDLIIGSGKPVVLEFAGAVERLRSVTAFGAAIGVRGVDAARLHLPDPTTCRLPLVRSDTVLTHRISIDVVAGLSGRWPDATVTAGRVGEVTVPSGDRKRLARTATETATTATGQDGETAPLWDRFRFRIPGGLVSIPAESVMANRTATSYGVLPYEAGLARMVEAGQLALVDPGEFDERPPSAGKSGAVIDGVIVSIGPGRDAIVLGDRVYRRDGSGGWRGGRLPTLRILTTVRMPTGLTHLSARFVLPDGVPRPMAAAGRRSAPLRIEVE